MSFEHTPRSGTIKNDGNVCSTGGNGTVLCDRPILRNTGLHEVTFKQTSFWTVLFGAASATADLEMSLGRQNESAAFNTGGTVWINGQQKKSGVKGCNNQEPVALVVDTDVPGALELVASIKGSEWTRLPIQEGWRFAVG